MVIFQQPGFDSLGSLTCSPAPPSPQN